MSDTGHPEIVNQRWIASKLRCLRFVEWDRFTVGEWNGQQSITVYGWIPREDSYKDFVVLIFWPEEQGHYFTTSSAEHPGEIHQLLTEEPEEATHNSCNRVEETFNVSNAIQVEQ